MHDACFVSRSTSRKRSRTKTPYISATGQGSRTTFFVAYISEDARHEALSTYDSRRLITHKAEAYVGPSSSISIAKEVLSIMQIGMGSDNASKASISTIAVA